MQTNGEFPNTCNKS